MTVSTPGTPQSLSSIPAAPVTKRSKPRFGSQKLKLMRQSWQLYAMLALPLLWLLIFQYIPMYGAQIAFRNYNVVAGITGSKWVGLDHFDRFIHSYNFWPIIKNTLVLNIYSLIAGFPLPIILAIGLNFIMRGWFRRSVQMVTYAPHFISTVVMAGLILQLLSPVGLVNQLLGVIGVGPVYFMGEPQHWKSIYVWTEVWQHLGFNCIIYLAALTAIDPTLHEAAIMDGANKLHRIRDIDLPGIMPVAVILLILNMGYLLSSGFEKAYLLQTPLNLSNSEVIDTYVFRVGLQSQVPNFSYAASIGLFKSVVGLVLIFGANWIARRLKVASLW